MSEEQVGILGPGAVGHMLAFFFNTVPNLRVQMRGKQGLWSAGQPIQYQNQIYNLRLDTAGPTPRLWFVSLKAHALVDGLRPVLRNASQGSQFIILGNGYLEPLLSPLRQEFPQIMLRKGLVSRGVKSTVNGVYSLGAQGQVIWGDEQTPTAVEQLILQSLANQGFQWNSECCRMRREKWYMNTCLNSLCGVRRLARNGLAVEQYRGELAALSRETIALACELWPDWRLATDELWQNLLRLIQLTADNENSMAADVRLGRRTEASVLSGMVHQARRPEDFPLLLSFDKILQST